ncbi:MAG: hypothetical protein IJZ30_01665 [Alphaproteobacteria bacterium]|nr:hypothetical protein [Alphaproteobacteria bacterium]
MNKNEIKELENIYNAIKIECSFELYNEDACYHEISEKIVDTSGTLLSLAYRIVRFNLDKDENTNLTIDRIKTLLSKIYETLQEIDFYTNKEKHIDELVSKYAPNGIYL